MTAGEVRRFKFPPPFGERTTVWTPLGDPVTLPRHIHVQQVDSFLAVRAVLAYSLRLFAPVLPVFSSFAGFALDKIIGLGRRGPQEERRQAAQWAVVAEASSPKGQRRVSLQGSDVYGLTAVIVVWAAGQMLAPGFDKAGVLGPAQAFDPAAAIEYLKDFGVRFEE
jgi:short subunit dehydrogenase-like uncharacterized protein